MFKELLALFKFPMNGFLSLAAYLIKIINAFADLSFFGVFEMIQLNVNTTRRLFQSNDVGDLSGIVIIVDDVVIDGRFLQDLNATILDRINHLGIYILRLFLQVDS